MSPDLSLVYNSNGPDGILGPRWALGGLSVISCLPANRYYDGIHNAAIGGDYAEESVEAFSLDGKRLLPVGGDQDNRIYKLENDEFINVYKKGRAVGGRADGFYFIAKTKSGLTYYYGNDENSCHNFLVPYTDFFETVSFYVSRIEDELGNAIEFNYYNDLSSGEIRIENIQYTIHEGRTPLYNVKFYYEIDRYAPLKAYLAYPSQIYGNSVHFTTTKLLSSIQCIYNNTTSVKKYILEYTDRGPGSTTDCKIKHLNKIQEFGVNDAESYNKLLFEWSPEMDYDNYNLSNLVLPATTYSEYNIGNQIQHITKLKSQFVELNGDGNMDIFRTYLVQSGNYYGLTLYMYDISLVIEYIYRQNNGEYILSNSYTHQLNQDVLGYTTGLENFPAYSFLFGDFTGDGLIDYLYTLYDYNYPTSPDETGTLEHTNIKLFTNLGNGNYNHELSNKYYNVSIEQPNVGDFNGDGISDLVIRQPILGNLVWRLGSNLNTLTSNSETINGITKSYNPQNTVSFNSEDLKWSVLDFNGDGRSELFALNKIFYLKPEVSSNNIVFDIKDSNKPSQSFLVMSNSDNKLDVVKFLTSNENPVESYVDIQIEFKTKLGMGEIFPEFYDNSMVYTFSEMLPDFTLLSYSFCDAGAEVRKCLNGDFNGDGLTDLLLNVEISFTTFLEQNQAPPLALETIKTNRNFVAYASNNLKYYVLPLDNNILNSDDIKLADINSDGQTDLYKYEVNDQAVETVNIYGPSANINRIVTITNSLGTQTKICYDYTSNNNFYIPGAVASYPIAQNNALQILVNKVEKSNGFGGWFTTEYQYERGISHANGLGYLGFERIIRKDIQSGYKYINDFGVNPAYFYVYPSVQTKWLIDGGIVEQTYNTFKHIEAEHYYNTTTYLSTTYFIQPLNIQTFYYELDGPSQKSTHTFKGIERIFSDYDEYGNVGTIQEKYSDYSETKSTLKFQKITTHDYSENVEFSALGRLTKATTTVTSLDTPSDPDINEVQFEYFPVETIWKAMLKTEKTITTDGSKNVTKTYEYDIYGNILSTTLSANDHTSRIEGTSYTADGRFIEEITNPAGHKIKRIYNAILGSLDQVLDISNNLLLSSHAYNSFGNLWKTVDATGLITIDVLRWTQPNDDDAPENSISTYYVWHQTSGNGYIKTYYNSIGQELRTVTIGYDGSHIFVDNYYNSKGQLFRKSEPYFKGTQAYYTEFFYDDLGRLKILSIPGINAIHYNFDGLNTSKIDPMGNTTSTKTNVLGWIIESTDEKGNNVLHTYYNSGLVHTTKVEDEDLTLRTYEYDVCDNLHKYHDNSQGTIIYEYNAYGDLIKEINARNEVTTYNGYDGLGRVENIITPEGTTTYTYDLQKKGKLDLIDGPNQSIEYKYDNYLRVVNVVESVEPNPQNSYQLTYTYDECSRINELIYPTGYSIRNVYNELGYQSKIIENTSNKILWKVQEINARQQFEQIKYGEKITQTIQYSADNGRLKQIVSPNLQNNIYTWYDNGNLKSRRTQHGKFEEFFYDELKRLTSVNFDQTPVYTYQYDDLGNLIFKSDVGLYTYNTGLNVLNPNPYQLLSINNKPATINDYRQDIYYTSFNKVYQITETDDHTQLIVKQLDIYYGVNNQKIKQIYAEQGDLPVTKLFLFDGLFEVETTNTNNVFLHYIQSPQGLIAVEKWSNSGKELTYVLTDHQGSIQIVTNEEGELISEFSYDPWGLRRDPTTFIVFTSTTSNYLSRGYTGHEHIDLFMLVNMDGRIYDPVLGRFLSPDPFLQFPDYTQGLNPYCYVLNNPLNYTDPTGYSVEGQFLATTLAIIVSNIPGVNIILAPLVYTVIMTIDYSIENGRKINAGDLFTYFSQTFITSAITMCGTKVIGEAFKNIDKMSIFGKELSRAFAHGIFNGAQRMMQGGKFEHGFMSGFVSSAAGSAMIATGLHKSFVSSVIASAVIGGTVEKIGGGKFGNGAITGAYVMALNHLSRSAFYDAQLKKMYYIYKESEQYDTPAKLYEHIGGPLGNWAAESPEQFKNTCAARLSLALNYSGFEIPAGTSGTYQGGDGKYYFIKALTMSVYLNRTDVWGLYKTTSYNNINNAVIYQTGFEGVSGHMDVIYRYNSASGFEYSTMKTYYWH